MAGETTKWDKPAEEIVQNKKIGHFPKVFEARKPASMDGTLSDAVSCISSGDATSSIKESDVGQEALMAEQGMYYPVSYYGYYYPGSNSSFGEWDDQGYYLGTDGMEGYYLGTDGMELQQPAFQAENGSVLYYMPDMPGYNTYNPFLSGSAIGVDGQYLGQQAYVPSPLFQQPLLSPGYFPTSVAYGPETVPAYTWDSSHLYGDGVYYGNGFIVDSTISAPKTNFSPQSHYVPPTKPTVSSKSSNPLEIKGPSPVRDVSPTPGVHNQSIKPVNKATAVLSKGYFPTTKFPTYPNQGKGGLSYPATPVNVKENGRFWIGSEKVKAQSNSNGVGNSDLLDEQNCGPRTNSLKTTWISGVNPTGILVGQGNDKNSCTTDVVKREDYNLLEFPTKYDDALFFVIKSYSEDDIHKSIKYNVWSSTTNGNKRLDSAFQVAQERIKENGSKCPVFFFFSVNASGQFCGVAEMTGRVDFSKNMDFWQQDKWNGFFPVKWHIIKDVPNPQFRHIILENNDNKPVTNSRDTQEVNFLQGIEVLNIFKNYCSKTSILDDFSFYENRQRAMQDRRIKLPTTHLQHLLFQPKMDGITQVNKADDLKPLVSGLQAIDLGAAKKIEEPHAGMAVKE